MAFIDFISKEDYGLVNEAFTRKHNRKYAKTHEKQSAKANEWHKHDGFDKVFREDIERIKGNEMLIWLSPSFKEIPCFSKNSDVLFDELKNRLDGASYVTFSAVCFELLLSYHLPAEECQIYMLSAFKFLLKILELAGVATVHLNFGNLPHKDFFLHRTKTVEYATKRMWHYFDSVRFLQLPQNINLWILHVFCKDTRCLNECFSTDTNIKTVMNICRKQRNDVLGLFKANGYNEEVNCIINFGYGKLKYMICLLLMGMRHKYQMEGCDRLRTQNRLLSRTPSHEGRNVAVDFLQNLRRQKEVIAFQDFEQSRDIVRRRREVNISNESEKKKIRCHHVLYLYLMEEERRKNYLHLLVFKRESIQGGLFMKVLWGTITDSFLTKEEFQLISSDFSEEKIQKCFEWYENLVTRGRIGVKEPRSLKHLARCRIRQRLAENFSLPVGTDQLPLPRKLISYLNVISDPKNLRYLAKCVIRKRLCQYSSFPEGMDHLPLMDDDLKTFMASMDDPFQMYL